MKNNIVTKTLALTDTTAQYTTIEAVNILSIGCVLNKTASAGNITLSIEVSNDNVVWVDSGVTPVVVSSTNKGIISYKDNCFAYVRIKFLPSETTAGKSQVCIKGI